MYRNSVQYEKERKGMKKYLKRGLTVLTCAAMCIQSPLITMAEEIQRTNGEASAYQADNYGVATQAQKEPQWIKDSAGWWYQNADGSYPRNQWKMINGSWYHFDWNGYMQTGWQKIGGSWYYLNAGGDMRTGWLQSGNAWYYLKSSGAMAIGWEKIGSDWYYLNSSGAMQTGWLQLGNTWYYLKSSGAMAINEWVDGGAYYVDANGVYIPGKTQTTEGWKKNRTGWWYQNVDGSYPRNQWKMIGGSWYHFDWNGYMQTGWQVVWGSWYYLNAGGDMRTGWLQSGNAWYYLKSSGAMAIGWEKIGSDWYYLNSSGAMQTGWLQLGNTWYYLKSSGAMALDEWVDGGKYYVDANGVYIPEKKQESTETPETKPETKPGTNNKEDSDKPESKPEHEHKYDIELSHIVHHEATGHDEQYVVKEAWDEEVTVEEEYAWSCCNVCGADCTNNLTEHQKAHALAYEGGGWHTEYGTRLVTTTVHHDAIYGTRWVQDSEAYDEKIIDGYACICGEKMPKHEHKYDIELSHIVHHEATGHEEQYVVKEAWDEEVTTEEEYAWDCCNVCGADCTDDPWGHMYQHASNYEGGGYHVEYGTRLVTTTVHHDAIYGTRWVQDSEAYDEKIIDGYACSCGAKK